MATLKAGIVLSAVDKATAPLKGLSRSAGATQATLAKLSGQAGQLAKLRGLRSEVGALGPKLDVSRKKTSELGRELKAAENPSEKLRRAFERSQRQTISLARAHGRQKGELRDLSASLRRAGVDTRRLDAAQERLGRTSERLRGRLDRLGKARATPRAGGALRGHLGALGAYVGGGALPRGVGGFVETASKFEDLESTLATIEGSSQKARESFGWVKEFTSSTPYQLDQVAESFVKLRAYGIDPIGGALQTLGDTASGMGKSLEQAVEALADARLGEYERLKEFAISARTKGDTVTFALGSETRSVDKGSPEAIQGALLGLMEGKFGGGMEAKMKLFSGLASNLGDKWTEFQDLVMDAGPFELLKDRMSGVLARVNAMAASGELEALADRVGQSLVSAFEGFERDVLPVLRDDLWPALRDDIWPALKDIAGTVGEIFKGANQVAGAVGGWGNVIKAFAAYKALSIGGSLAAGGVGKIRSAREFGGDLYGGLRDVATSDRARRMGSAAKSLAGRAGGSFAALGGKLSSLALRVAPLAMGALKGVAVAISGLSLPVTAAAVAIAGSAYLIWRHWEPIKGFFGGLWGSVKAAFSSAWEWLSSIDWGGLGKRLMTTLAEGVRDAALAPFNALKFALGKLKDLLPGSDARAGPLSRLTASGAAILPTIGAGVRRAGASPLRRPLAAALGAAALSLPAPAVATPQPLSLPAPAVATPQPLSLPAPAVATPQPLSLPGEEPSQGPAAAPTPAGPALAAPQAARTVHHHHDYRISIQQLPGESAEELADRVIEKLEDAQRQGRLEGLYDAG